jgi:Predicted acyltransferase
MKPASYNVRYRLLKPEETITVAQLATKVFDEFIAPLYSAEGVTEFHRYANPIALDARNQDDHITLVAENDQQIVGMLQLRAFTHVAMLFVCSGYQRSGVGRGLLSQAIQLCQRHSPKTHQLTVKSSPNAVNAYVRMGFTATGPERCERGIRCVPMELAI